MFEFTVVLVLAVAAVCPPARLLPPVDKRDRALDLPARRGGGGGQRQEEAEDGKEDEETDAIKLMLCFCYVIFHDLSIANIFFKAIFLR